MNTYCLTCQGLDTRISNGDNACCSECGETERLIHLLPKEELVYDWCNRIAHARILSIKKDSAWRGDLPKLLNKEVIAHYNSEGNRNPWLQAAFYKSENPDLKMYVDDYYIVGVKLKIIHKLT